MSKAIEPVSVDIDRVATAVVDAAYTVHKALGPGLLEHVYEVCLAHELTKRGFYVQRQVEMQVQYDGIRFNAGYRLDLVAENAVIVEIKSVEAILPVHKAQVLTYLKLADMRLGLLINFNAALIKDSIKRIAN